MRPHRPSSPVLRNRSCLAVHPWAALTPVPSHQEDATRNQTILKHIPQIQWRTLDSLSMLRRIRSTARPLDIKANRSHPMLPQRPHPTRITTCITMDRLQSHQRGPKMPISPYPAMQDRLIAARTRPTPPPFSTRTPSSLNIPRPGLLTMEHHHLWTERSRQCIKLTVATTRSSRLNPRPLLSRRHIRLRPKDTMSTPISFLVRT